MSLLEDFILPPPGKHPPDSGAPLRAEAPSGPLFRTFVVSVEIKISIYEKDEKGSDKTKEETYGRKEKENRNLSIHTGCFSLRGFTTANLRIYAPPRVIGECTETVC